MSDVIAAKGLETDEQRKWFFAHLDSVGVSTGTPRFAAGDTVTTKADKMRQHISALKSKLDHPQAKEYLDSVDNRVYMAAHDLKRAPTDSKQHYETRLQNAVDHATWATTRSHLAMKADLEDLSMTDAIIAPVVALDDTAPEVEIDLSAFETTFAVKAIGDTRIGGYLVVFNQRDPQGDTFLKSTDYALDWPLPTRPVLYHHGLKGDISAVGAIDKLTPDEKGVYAEADLKAGHPMYGDLKANLDAGKIFWSSGSLNHLVRKTADKQITRWPIVEGSLTYDPVERRGTNVSHLTPQRGIKAAYKAFNLPLDVLELDETEERETAQKSRASAKVERITNGVGITIKPNPENIKMEMTQEQFQTAVADAVKALNAPKPVDPLEAVKAEFAAIVAEQKRQIDTLQTTLAARPSPSSPLPVEQPTAAVKASQIVVGGSNRMMEDWNSMDMAFYAQIMDTFANNPTTWNTQTGKLAREFNAQRQHDPDHKFERAMSVKAHQEVARKRMPEQLHEHLSRVLPYKSIEDAYANRFDGDAIKSNELSSTGQAGSGTEFVPIVWRDTIWERVRLANAVASNMQRIPMTTNPMYISLEGADPAMYYTPETTDAASLVYNATNTVGLSKPVTAKATLTAKKLAGRTAFSMEYGEDALAFMIPRYHYQLVRAAQNAVDNTVLNGDTVVTATTNINFIDGTPGTAPTIPNYIAFDGMRKFCILTNTAQFIDGAGAGYTVSLIRSARKALGPVYGLDMPNLVYIIDYASYYKLIALPEYSFWESMGAPAANLTGTLPGGSTDLMGEVARPIGMIDGSPVYVSAELGLSLSTGKKNGTTLTANVYGNMQIFHKSRWYLGVKRDIDFESAVLPLLSDVQILQVTVRCTVASFDTQSAALLSDMLV